MNKFLNKKTFALIGMIISLVVVFCGFLAMTGALGGNASYASGSSYFYDSGYASFGADFYTYVSNNAAEAADAASTAAANVRHIADLMKNVFGIFLMGFGMMGFCFFGMAFADAKAAAPAVVAPVEEVVAEPAAPVEEVPAEEEAPAEAPAEF